MREQRGEILPPCIRALSVQQPWADMIARGEKRLNRPPLPCGVLEVDGGRVILYPGGYDDYESARLARLATARPEPEPVPAAKAAFPAAKAGPSARPSTISGANCSAKARNTSSWKRPPAPPAANTHATAGARRRGPLHHPLEGHLGGRRG